MVEDPRSTGAEHDDGTDEIPGALLRDLQDTFAPGFEISAAVDRRILAAARRRTVDRPRILRVVRVAGLAAAVLLSVLIWNAQSLRDAFAPAGQVALREDYDGNGRVDILDAYRLALAIDRGDAMAERWDLDGDGRIDGGDVSGIARRAVAVGRGGE
jgi:hypothetical protein